MVDIWQTFVKIVSFENFWMSDKISSKYIAVDPIDKKL